MDDLERLLDDPAAVLDHESSEIRRLALSALSREPKHLELFVAALRDGSPRVRAEAAEALGSFGDQALPALSELTANEGEDLVIEAIAFAYGEVGNVASVPWLIEVATGSNETLTRETAVASLGAVGDRAAVDTLLSLVTKAPPQVRRRAVVALTAFDGDDVEAAIRAAIGDRNPMVREAAEMVVGRPQDKWVGLELRRD